jgi:hypothetical protein
MKWQAMADEGYLTPVEKFFVRNHTVTEKGAFELPMPPPCPPGRRSACTAAPGRAA